MGHFTDNQWNFATIEIQKGAPIIDKPYKVTKNVNLRKRYPKLTLFGYKYGDTSGFLVSGRKVVIKEIKEVGRNKVWAHIRVE